MPAMARRGPGKRVLPVFCRRGDNALNPALRRRPGSNSQTPAAQAGGRSGRRRFSPGFPGRSLIPESRLRLLPRLQ